ALPIWVGLVLPARAGEGLLEVARTVEEADADDRHPEVRGGLEVVAGEDAQAAGVLGQHRGDAELGGEVGDGLGLVLGVEGLLVPARLLEVLAQVGVELVDAGDERLVTRELLQTRLAQLPEQLDRVAVEGLPAFRVERLEQGPGGLVPREPQVLGEGVQRSEGLGQDRADGKSTDGSHPSECSPDSATFSAAYGQFQRGWGPHPNGPVWPTAPCRAVRDPS